MTDTSNIDEDQLTRAFNDIVKCLDDTDDEQVPVGGNTHPAFVFITPTKSNIVSSSPMSSDSILSNLLPKTRSLSPTHKKTLDSRAVGGPSSTFQTSPSSSSFKGGNENWTKTPGNGVWKPSNTSPSQVSPPIPNAAHTSHSDLPPGIFINTSPPSSPPVHPPPGDYVCRLCSIPGHWLKDCRLYTPHQSTNGHARSPSSSSSTPNAFTSTTHRSALPPGNYVCRLCDVPGHWIEDCEYFEPRSNSSTHNQHHHSNFPHGTTPVRHNHTSNNNGSGTFTAFSTPPPASYVCKLCDLPGHWIQQCTSFVPVPPRRRH